MYNRPSMFFKLKSKYLDRCRDTLKGKLIARNTRIQLIDGVIVIKYYNTKIIHCYSNGTMVFNIAGWATRSTRSRLNKFSPLEIYFFSRKTKSLVNVNGYWFEFADGMSITRDLKVSNANRAKMPKAIRYYNLTEFLTKLKVHEERE